MEQKNLISRLTTLVMEVTECIEDKKVHNSLPLGPKRSHSNQVNNFIPFPFLRPLEHYLPTYVYASKLSPPLS
jgi:hypothetical protein